MTTKDRDEWHRATTWSDLLQCNIRFLQGTLRSPAWSEPFAQVGNTPEQYPEELISLNTMGLLTLDSQRGLRNVKDITGHRVTQREYLVCVARLTDAERLHQALNQRQGVICVWSLLRRPLRARRRVFTDNVMVTRDKNHQSSGSLSLDPSVTTLLDQSLTWSPRVRQHLYQSGEFALMICCDTIWGRRKLWTWVRECLTE